MKKILFLLLVTQVSFGQTLIKSLTELKARKGTDDSYVELRGTTALNLKPSTYYWDDISTSTGNDSSVVAVTGVTTGRWIRKVGTVGGVIGATAVYAITSASNIQSNIDATSSNAYISVQPGTYNITSTINFIGKTKVVIEGYGTATWTTANLQNLLITNGTTDCEIRGINFANTLTSGNNSLVLTNEPLATTRIKFYNCTFVAPNSATNGITASMYSVQANGGNGTGKLLDSPIYEKCDFGPLGRMGIELVNHAWDDNKLDIYIKNVLVTNCNFHDLGKINDGTAFNGMAFSNSGAAINTTITNCHITDANLLGIELAGTYGGIISNNTIDYINNTFVGISASDNQHKVTGRIVCSNNVVRSKTRPLAFNGITNFSITGGSLLADVLDNSNGSSVYFQNCNRGNVSGLIISTGSYNSIRIDDSSKINFSSMTITNLLNTNNYSLISIYGTTGAAPNGSFYNKVNTASIIFEKSNGVATTGVTEQIGNYGNNSL